MENNLTYLESAEQPEQKIAGYITTGKEKKGQRAVAAKRGPLPRGASRVEKMVRRLGTKAGAKIYALRKAIVEPVFGQIKQARGIRQFLSRALEKVRSEWAFVCLMHNILKMQRVCYG